MGKPIYTAEAHVTGGRLARPRPHQRRGARGRPAGAAGAGRGGAGTNPEQLFAVGYAACFEGALATVARRKKLEAGDVEIDSKVMLVAGEERSFTVAVELAVTLPSVEGEDAVELVRSAHKVCPYSNATRGNIEMTLSANGAPVEL